MHGRDRARILHHVGQELAEQAGVDLVDLLVALPHVERLGDIAVGEGVEHVLERRAHQAAQPVDAGHRPTAGAVTWVSTMVRLAMFLA